jgi:hypothetical protein
MSVGLEGGCSCGQIRYRLTARPMVTHCCHCLSCQRQTGSACAINMLIEAGRVQLVSGRPRRVDVPRDDGSAQEIFRCPTCQVAVYSLYSRADVWFVRAGTLDDPSQVTPDVHIFTRSKRDWITLPDAVPAYDVYYDLEVVWRPESLARLAALDNAAAPGR